MSPWFVSRMASIFTPIVPSVSTAAKIIRGEWFVQLLSRWTPYSPRAELRGCRTCAVLESLQTAHDSAGGIQGCNRHVDFLRLGINSRMSKRESSLWRLEWQLIKHTKGAETTTQPGHEPCAPA